MFSRLKIASRLLVGFGSLLLLMVGVCLFAGLTSLGSESALIDVARHERNELTGQRFETYVVEARMNIALALATGDQAFWSKSEEAFKAAAEWLATLKKNTKDPGRQAQIPPLGELLKQLDEGAGKLRAFTAQNHIDTPEGQALLAAIFKVSAEISDHSSVLGQDYEASTTKTVSAAESLAHLSVELAIGIGFASLLLGFSLSYLITISIKRPVLNLTRGMSSLVNGDLRVEIPHTTENNEIGEMAKAVLVFQEAAIENVRLEREAAEHRARADGERARNEQAQQKAIWQERAIVANSIGAALSKLAAKDLTYRMSSEIPEAYRVLQADFNAAIGQLEEAMRRVTGSSCKIEAGSQEISSASNELARRTEQQAASLEETAAALDEITATVGKSAQGAKQARQVVAAANDDATKTAIVVHQAVQAMDAISQSSRQISQIISVIDEIAFQTNLLALNAGVEAARAGDTGKGFAVVASEVRALAQRSAEAAKEIKGLILTSSTHVENGVKLVVETGKSLERIIVQVNDLNKVVAEIATGSQEQAVGLAEINTAINQMDQITQQNAAMVEESTAASFSLSQATNQLSGLINEFQIRKAAGDESMRGETTKIARPDFRRAG